MAKPRLKLRFCKLDHNRGSLWLEERRLAREPKDVKKEWLMERGRWKLPVGGWRYQWEEEWAHKTRGKEKCVFRWYLLGVKREHRACGSFWRRHVRAGTSPLNSPIWLQPLVFLRQMWEFSESWVYIVCPPARTAQGSLLLHYLLKGFQIIGTAQNQTANLGSARWILSKEFFKTSEGRYFPPASAMVWVGRSSVWAWCKPCFLFVHS